MSVDPTDPQFQAPTEGIESALVVHCRLTNQQIQRVRDAVKSRGLSFSEAAVQSGVVTQHELDKTIDFVNATADQRHMGIIETAIRRRKPSRELIVRHGDLVKPGKELVLLHDPYSARSETIRALRTELMLLDDTPSQANVIAMVSPCRGEGRSLLAAELAIAFSQLNRRTLLVDADLRHPRQHEIFNSQNSWGLTQALASASATRLAGVEGLPLLSLLTAGPVPPNPLEMLSDGRFGRFIADWRYNFDDIVIDTPPVSLYADGLAIATFAGRALVLSRAALTPRRDMKEMMRRLENTQARVMGAVLSNF